LREEECFGASDTAPWLRRKRKLILTFMVMMVHPPPPREKIALVEGK
jgi:hypothetical protein